MRVLVVDDSRAMRVIIRRELRSGADIDDVIEADSGLTAIEVLQKEAIDLVISGWNMPGMTGIELLETLRTNGWAGRFGFITSESGQSTRTRAFEAGANFLVTKPFTGESLSRQIDLAFGETPTSAVLDDPGAVDSSGPTVASVLERLLRREVSVVTSDPPRREVARTLARYVDAAGNDIAACIAEIAFAAATGAALSLAPTTTAAEWAAAGVLTEAIAQNFYEVANVLAPVVSPGGAHCTLAEVILLADFEQPPNAEELSAALHVNLKVTVDKYGSGRIALIALEPGEPAAGALVP